jgi:putative PIN family toxin of toxin-antitoxin system
VIRAVLDTNIFLRGLINPHSRCGRLLSDLAPSYTLLISPAIVREILEVLHRPKIRARFPHIAEVDVARVIALFATGEVFEPTEVPAVSRDVKDDIFLACACQGGADYLVSEDKDLLCLQEYEGTRIVSSREFIEILEKHEDLQREGNL